MHFDEALAYLLSLGAETLAIKLGLKNTELLLAALGNPQKSYFSVQIAGTNGKGSTAVLLDSICRAAGIKTGLYTSPHLVSITERIRIGSKEIAPEEFARQATAVRSASLELLERRELEALPTFFEQVTAIALSAFHQTKVDVAILETGLGGRLDATTVAGAPLVAITPIALDHEDYLGKTLESIAAEKAAIIRPGVTALIAPQPPQAVDAILKQCERCGVQPNIDECGEKVEGVTRDGRFRVTFRTSQDQYGPVVLGLRGRHQITNSALAIRLAESLRAYGFPITRAAIIEGIETARHSGRLELLEGSPSLLFDGAHNPAATRVLRDYLEEFVQVPITLVFGGMRDKDLETMGSTLFPMARRVVLTQLDNPRAASLERLQQVASGLIADEKISATTSVRSAIQQALLLTPADGLVCFSGSLYLIGEAQSVLKEMGTAKVSKARIS